MARAPFQVLVFPWRRNGDGEFEYAVFKRGDDGCWQGLSGGGEDNETPIEAARREANEEAGIPMDAEYLELDTVASIPAHIFAGHEKWGKDTLVIPEYSFGVDFSDEDLELSPEHSEYRWASLDEVRELLQYDSNRTAVYELDQRLHRGETKKKSFWQYDDKYHCEQLTLGEIDRVLRREEKNKLFLIFLAFLVVALIGEFSPFSRFRPLLLLPFTLYGAFYFGRYLFSAAFRRKVSKTGLNWPVCKLPIIGLFATLIGWSVGLIWISFC